MGECIISRASANIPEDILNPIPVVPTAHSILVTLKTPAGVPITNHIISCKDGSTYYNYTTNEKGQCLFTCMNGSGNIYVTNNINSIIYRDIVNTWINIDGPIGGSTRCNFKFNSPQYVDFSTSQNVNILGDRNVNICLIGGGGGGCGSVNGYNYGSAGGGTRYWYSGGDSGYMNTKITVLNAGIYPFVASSGGSGGPYMPRNANRYSEDYYTNNIFKISGFSGGTSTFYGVSAVGGIGGNVSGYNNITNIPLGGLGNGGYKANTPNGDNDIHSPESSPISFAGGGGAWYKCKWGTSTSLPGGSPCGGGSGWCTSVSSIPPTDHIYAGKSGSKGGGGGAACEVEYRKSSDSDSSWGTRGGSGGMGFLRIYFLD